MARMVRDQRLDSRSARLKLAPRREPYWRSISDGLAIGYRRGKKGGSWIARHYTAEYGRRYEALGTSDDVADADGVHVLSFAQAQEAAREWFASLAREDSGGTVNGPYTVRNAMDDYAADYKRRGGKAFKAMDYAIQAHILPELGSIELRALTHRRLATWQEKLVTTPPKLRSGKGKRPNYREVDEQDAEAQRKRRATANRIATVLKAALNHAFHQRRVATKDAWDGLRPFREVEAPRVRYFEDEDVKRLINVCPADLRRLVTAALLSGCRYGELAALRVHDFDTAAKVLHIERSKSGKARHVALTNEGVDFFERQTAGKEKTALILERDGGKPWKKSDYTRPFRQACETAQVDPAVGFHGLRHTYASRLAMRGTPMAVIAAQLGHADTRMTERHYAHLAPSYVAEAVRSAFGELGIVEADNVKKITAA